MKLTTLAKKLKAIKNRNPYLNVLGCCNDNYYYLEQFHTFSLLNRLHGYFQLTKSPNNHTTVHSLIIEIEDLVVLFSHYPDLMMVAPQLNLIKRDSTRPLKFLELSYNVEYNTIILE